MMGFLDPESVEMSRFLFRNNLLFVYLAHGLVHRFLSCSDKTNATAGGGPFRGLFFR